MPLMCLIMKSNSVALLTMTREYHNSCTVLQLAVGLVCIACTTQIKGFGRVVVYKNRKNRKLMCCCFKNLYCQLKQHFFLLVVE